MKNFRHASKEISLSNLESCLILKETCPWKMSLWAKDSGPLDRDRSFRLIPPAPIKKID